MPHLIALIGLGAIATKQHLPSIAANPDFTLVAAASLAGAAPGIPLYPDHRALLAAQITLSDGSDAQITGDFDWSWQGPDNRQISIETTDGQTIELLKSGAILTIDGATVLEGPRDEYGAIYRDFSILLTERRSSIDAAPLDLVADIFLAATSVPAPPVRQP